MPDGTNTSKSLGRILVVDDDPAILDMVSRFLSVLNFDVTSAADGSEALALINDEQFDLIISDLMMPTVSGKDLIETMKSAAIETDILFMSAVGTITDVVELMKLGAVGFLEKPFRVGQLRKEVFAAMQERKARDQLARRAEEGQRLPSVSISIDEDDTVSKPASRVSGTPETVGRYEIRDLIGEGGMGCVYRAYDPRLDRDVAIKIIRIDKTSPQAQEFAERFHVEARAAAGLTHPAIVSVYDFGEDAAADRHFLVMELIRGPSLSQVIYQSGPLSLPRVVNVAYQLVDALSFAHRKGVVHRDIKPGNVLLLSGDRVKLVDFGIARFGNQSLTIGRRLLGSPPYLSPEAALGDPIDYRGDQFSLGTIIIELLTGRRIFEAPNLLLTVKRVREVPTPPLSTFVPGVPATLERVVAKLHEKAAADRYEDETALLRDLAEVGRELSLDLRPVEA